MQKHLSGMDINQIRSMAGNMDRKAEEIRSAIDQLSGAVTAVSWAGPDRDRFVDEWRNRHVSSLRAVADNLSSAARQARDHAAEQERVSRSGGSGTGVGGGGGGPW